MAPLCLTVVWFFISGMGLDVVGGAMCDDGWVYHSGTASCLKILYDLNNTNPCLGTKGGEHRNISGDIVNFTASIQPFLREYLQFMNVSSALVQVPFKWMARGIWFMDSPIFLDTSDGNVKLLSFFVPEKPNQLTRYSPDNEWVICQVMAAPFELPSCPRNVKLVSVSERNVTLSWSPGQPGRKVAVTIDIQRCNAEGISCEHFMSKTFQDVSRFQLRNYTVIELQPNTNYKLVLQIVHVNGNTESCSGKLMLSTTKGEESNGFVIGLSIMMPVSLCACVVLAILLFRYYRQTSTEPGQESNGTVIGLSIMFSISLGTCVVFAVLLWNHLQANNGQESNGTVIGLSIMFSICLGTCVALAVLLLKHYRQTNRDKDNGNGVTERTVTKVMRPKLSPEIKLEDYKNQASGSGLCRNVQQQPHECDRTFTNKDDHISEM
ncbi:hypothetical protein BsWGS_03803 [Bradybaena similaris]